MLEAISHRGSRAAAPENTVGAVVAAVAEGADGVEVDVHCTRDGVVVVHHDFVPRGAVADRRLAQRPIADLTLDEIRQFDLGGGAGIPSLAQLIDCVAGRARLYVEIKGSRCEQQLASVLSSAGSAAAVHSFNHRSIRRMFEIAPALRRGVLQGSYMIDNCAALTSAAALDLWQHWQLIDEELVAEAHRCGARVIAWTANDEREWDLLAAAGVDAICTDDVGRLVRWRDARHS